MVEPGISGGYNQSGKSALDSVDRDLIESFIVSRKPISARISSTIQHLLHVILYHRQVGMQLPRQ